MAINKEKFYKFYELDLSKLYKQIGIKSKIKNGGFNYYISKNVKLNLTYDIEGVNKNNVKDYIEKGLVDQVKIVDLLKEVSDLKEEDYEVLCLGLDLKTKRYFDKIAEEIGLEKVIYKITDKEKEGFEPLSKDEESDILKLILPSMSRKVEILKNGNKYMVTSIEYSCTDEPSLMEAYIFNKKPTSSSILTVDKMEKVKSSSIFENYNFEYKCPICGKVSHWLDTKVDDGEIYQVLDRKFYDFKLDFYCECCE